MTPESWQRVKELFSAASELPADDTAAWLDAACGGDAQLRAEVDSLLAAHATREAVVDQPAIAHLPPDFGQPDRDRWIGRRLGAYEIVELIGHGGMGEVYRARRVDAEYDKEVAIKLVPGGLLATQVARRIRSERQILADLDHPGIARLIDGGVTEDGTPYLVMELVAGEPLDRYIAAHTPPLATRLALFLDVCAAVSHAHRHLVVHRDLKPGNILVTPQGQVKLLDFGIARLLQPGAAEAAAVPTVTLLRTLTPGFASPEQVLGRPVTTASDVYSLGVVLYVLLTGCSPYRRAMHTAEDAIHEVCNTEPVRPSAAMPARQTAREAIGRDLDAIILRALRKEPERRYASVDRFAEDIRRYLDGRPVAARGDVLSYRAGKFMRRHVAMLAAAAALLLTLVGATVVSLREARIADQQRARAERHFASVRALANSFMFEVHDAIEPLAGATRARELLVGTAMKYLDSLAGEAGDDAALRLELAAAYEKVADVQGTTPVNKGEPRAAIESYARAIALLSPIVAAEPAPAEPLRTLARIERKQAQLKLFQGETGEARSMGKHSVDRLASLARSQPDDQTLRELAIASQDYAVTLFYTGAPLEERMAHASRAVGILEEQVLRHPKDLELASSLSAAYNIKASTITGASDDRLQLEESLALLRKSQAIDERLVEATDGKDMGYLRNLSAGYLNIALYLYQKGAYQEALDNIHAGTAAAAAREADADDFQVRMDAAQAGWQEGRLLLALGRTGEAEAVLGRNLRRIGQIGQADDNLRMIYQQAATETYLAQIRERQSRREDARRLYESATQRFGRVTAVATLDYLDMLVVNAARDGLARTQPALVTRQTAR
ncbi:MAG: serine/threonine-protein kinase [Steroidobacteraceae bacterium]